MKNFIILLSFILSTPLLANIAPISNSIFDEMAFKSIVEVDLEVDMEALTGNIRNEDKHKATLSFYDKNGEKQIWQIKLELRGKFRRMRCSEMPPLKMNFDKDDLVDAGLAKYDDMKLVTHCIENKKMAKELLYKEYLAYKMYNQLTENSFRVQFLKVTYKDTVTGAKKKQWAFMIEDTAQLRARIGAKKVKREAQNDFELNQQQLNHMAVFQYMIGNEDWGVKNGKNVKVLKKDNKLIAIPYDFDFSGLVSPPYAGALPTHDELLQKNRFHLDTPEAINDFDKTLEQFKANKKELTRMIKKFKHLNIEARFEMINYINSFYKNIDKLRQNVVALNN